MSYTNTDRAAALSTQGDQHLEAARANLANIQPGVPSIDANVLAFGAQAQALLYIGFSLERIANALEAGVDA